MQRIFSIAASCEGGMLRGRFRPLTPEGYIGSWLRELAEPHTARCTTVTFSVGKGYTFPLAPSTKDQAAAALDQHGLTRQAENIRMHGKAEISLQTDADVVMDLMTQFEIAPCTLVPSGKASRERQQRDPTLGYRPGSARKAEGNYPEVLRLGRHGLLSRHPGGPWRYAGPQYANIADFVETLWKDELASPGTCRKKIKAFRDLLTGAPAAPAPISIEIDGRNLTDAYDRSMVAAVRREAGATSDPFRAKLSADNEYALTQLPQQCLTWLIPDHKSDPPASHEATQTRMSRLKPDQGYLALQARED